MKILVKVRAHYLLNRAQSFVVYTSLALLSFSLISELFQIFNGLIEYTWKIGVFLFVLTLVLWPFSYFAKVLEAKNVQKFCFENRESLFSYKFGSGDFRLKGPLLEEAIINLAFIYNNNLNDLPNLEKINDSEKPNKGKNASRHKGE